MQATVTVLREKAKHLRSRAAQSEGARRTLQAEADSNQADAVRFSKEADEVEAAANLLAGIEAATATVKEEMLRDWRNDCRMTAMTDHMRRLAARG